MTNETETLTAQKLNDICNLFSAPFVGYTMQPQMYARFEPNNRYTGALGESQLITAFCVANQPCPLVKWTSYKQMMKFVKRKDDEMRNYRNELEINQI